MRFPTMRPGLVSECAREGQGEGGGDTAIRDSRSPAWRWYAEVAKPNNSNPRNIKLILEKDVIPAIGDKPIAHSTLNQCHTGAGNRRAGLRDS
jgi:hypothetical protein